MRPRVALIDYFPPHYRKRLYEELARRMEVDFYFFSDEAERWQNALISADYEGNYRRVDLRRYRIAGQAVMPGIVPALSRRRYDAVVKSLNGKLMLPLTLATARARSLPFVLWTGMWHHPTTAFHRCTRALTEGVYRDADAIVAYGDHVKGFLTALPGVDPEKIFVSGQAVEGGRFEPVEAGRNGAADHGPDVLFVGQFKEYKGVRTLLDAFARLEQTGARLRMIGNGPLEGEIRAYAAKMRNVEIVGHVPQERLPAELARSRCLVLPSVTTDLDREPWGLVVNEAMHAGLPVVASDAVGAAAGGLVRDGSNGYVVPEGDPEALAGALRRLVDDSQLAARLGERSRHDVAAFSYKRMAQAFEQAIRHAVANRRGER